MIRYLQFEQINCTQAQPTIRKSMFLTYGSIVSIFGFFKSLFFIIFLVLNICSRHNFGTHGDIFQSFRNGRDILLYIASIFVVVFLDQLQVRLPFINR
jgi:hypothetical protein